MRATNRRILDRLRHAPAFVCLCVSMLLPPGGVARADVIPLTNPGFESDYTGWTYDYDVAGSIVTSSDARASATAMELARDNDCSLYQMTGHNIAEDDDITLRFWVKDAGYTGSSMWNVRIFYLDGASQMQTIDALEAYETGEWREVMLSFTVPAGDPSIGEELGVYFGNGRRGILLDDVAVEVNHTACVGDETVYGSQQGNANSRVEAVRFTMAEAGSLHSVSAYVRQNTTRRLRYAVYADAGGVPDALIAESQNDVTGLNDYHWHPTPMPATLLAAGDYWVAMGFEHSSARYRYQNGGPTVFSYVGSPIGGGFTDPWPASSTENRRIGIKVCYVPAGGGDLVAYYKLDEAGGYTAYDSSGWDNHGTLTAMNAATAWVSGKCDNGLFFDGLNDKVVVADSDELDGTPALTVAFWCRPDVLDGNPRGPISKRVHWTIEYSWGIFFYGGNRLNVDIETNDDRFASNYVFTAGQWYHIAVVFDGSLPAASRVKIYVDGTLDTIAYESSAAISNTASEMVLGQLSGNSSGYFYGVLDEVRVYRRALDASEVGALMSCPSTSSGVQVMSWREVIR